jgi:hypothetical protein
MHNIEHLVAIKKVSDIIQNVRYRKPYNIVMSDVLKVMSR